MIKKNWNIKMGTNKWTTIINLILWNRKWRAKKYWIKLKDNWKHEKGIKFEIKSVPQVKFAIKFKYNQKLTELQKDFNDSEETMNETLQKAYNLIK